jgi:Flp pilus assembly protein TadG
LRLVADDGGAVALEFAIVAGLFLAMAFGVIDVSQYYYASSALRDATETTLRNALVDATIIGCTAPKTKLAGTPVVKMTGFTMCVTRTTASGSTTIVADGTLAYQASAYALIVKSQTLKEKETTTLPD